MQDTETASPRLRGMDTWEDADILAALWEAQADAVAAVRPTLPTLAAAAQDAVARLRRGGRLIYAGAGTSGRLAAQDAAELGPTFGWPAERLAVLLAGGEAALQQGVEDAEDDTDGAAAAIAALEIGADDVLVAVAASGRTPYTVATAKSAGARGALVVAICNRRDTPLAQAARHVLLAETGPEVVAGSTRLKAGTAQKVMLNLLSTLVMTRLGHVHDGLMVDMRVSNAKLRGRAVEIVAKVAGCDTAAAAAALREAGGIKPAILCARGLRVAEARGILDRHEGSLRAALKECVG